MAKPGATRRWASRAVIAAAALASVATSKPKWHLDAELPAGAPTSTPAGGSQAIVIALEASEAPDVTCDVNGAMVPLRPTLAATPESTVVHAQFVCPPGGTLLAPKIYGDGHGRGCSSPEPPDDAFLRVTHLAATPVWTRNAFETARLHDSEYSTSDLRAVVEVHAAGQAMLALELMPSVDPHAIGGLRALPLGPNRYEIEASSLVAKPGPIEVRVHAIIYGACPSAKPCAPPDGDDPTIVVSW